MLVLIQKMVRIRRKDNKFKNKDTSPGLSGCLKIRDREPQAQPRPQQCQGGCSQIQA